MPIVDRTNPHTDPKNASWRSACHEDLPIDGQIDDKGDTPIDGQVDTDPVPVAHAG